ncbi:FKBP12-associated protein 1-like protein [Erysiphe neolycopersici]|uniref:FKBP12-associated protein 1-like protein n=1 Tax=Erysiphe neolycopersici TaxID=212602 RepID=A0A420HT20_9PEZI|nr:FKBP12-associated protein 1-like protein [Erysiphe neolycopersici]
MSAINVPTVRRPYHRHNRGARRNRESTPLLTEHDVTESSSNLHPLIMVNRDTSTHGQTPSFNRGNRSNTRARGRRDRVPTTQEPQFSSDRSNVTNPLPSSHLNCENRGKRGKRGRGRRLLSTRGTSTQSNVNRQRQFGSQLTSETTHDTNQVNIVEDTTSNVAKYASDDLATLRAKQQEPVSSRNYSPKSQAEDVATRTHEDIKNGQYECLICTDEILSSSKIWSCKTCWSVLHLSCVRHWVENEVSTYKCRATESSEIPPLRRWRCPGCNMPKDDLLSAYLCWCTKEYDPHPIAGLPPHSCGQTCARPRANHCPHPCESICHAGPCAPCNQMGPIRPCFCGTEKRLKKCIDTNYQISWSCEKVCSKLLPCGEHRCQRICHEGNCGSCELLIESRCYCAKVIRNMPCSKLGNVRKSSVNGKSWLGSFNCGTKCYRIFDCGNPKHFCEKLCHKQDEIPAHCPFSPDMVDHCPCGKTPISELLDEPRKDCSAPIPHCSKICEKIMSCGHTCKKKCHKGECRGCQEKTEISCRCGRIITDTLCHQGDEQKPHCTRVCRTVLNCGRHECSNRCCPGEKKASERLALKRKNRILIDASRSVNNFEPEHICIKVCGRTLKCGNHTCSALCHKGPCSSCLEAIFDEISCACSRTILHPPQPCGTIVPKCDFDCTRRRTCGHPMVKHQCHPDTESCPKCPFLVQKLCICGREVLKNQPCWFSEARCGLICGKKLKCGIHACRESCHRVDLCEDFDKACNQPCGRKKTVCEHSCSSQCHAPYPCKELQPCQAKTYITCPCKTQKQLVKCLASKNSSGNSQKTLACNDECLKLQRNAKIADALNIDRKTHQDDHIPYSTKTISMYLMEPRFGNRYEREFFLFAMNEDMKILRFKPMAPHQRAFIHSLAEDFGLCSESQDAEPHRFVTIFKTPRFASAPKKTLHQCIGIKILTENLHNTTITSNPKLKENWNAILLIAPRFGLTADEIQEGLGSELNGSEFKFEIIFLPSEEFLLRIVPGEHKSHNFEGILESKNIIITKLAIRLNLSENTTLCLVDNNLNILKRADTKTDHQGWNQVAKGGKNNKKLGAMGVEKSNSFMVLGNSKKLKVENFPAEEPPDDWEKEVDKWN